MAGVQIDPHALYPHFPSAMLTHCMIWRIEAFQDPRVLAAKPICREPPSWLPLPSWCRPRSVPLQPLRQTCKTLSAVLAARRQGALGSHISEVLVPVVWARPVPTGPCRIHLAAPARGSECRVSSCRSRMPEGRFFASRPFEFPWLCFQATALFCHELLLYFWVEACRLCSGHVPVQQLTARPLSPVSPVSSWSLTSKCIAYHLSRHRRTTLHFPHKLRAHPRDHLERPSGQGFPSRRRAIRSVSGGRLAKQAHLDQKLRPNGIAYSRFASPPRGQWRRERRGNDSTSPYMRPPIKSKE
ncbi:hypothetical protein IWX90DRAFT_173832 [Phyllosticta citrichinensis]|uniref:Uncharacterized protein n=1 Tax=Phyllosticta citrichinensis TaxID=1130410 RepID=A0ABR1XVB9_9PEZI